MEAALDGIGMSTTSVAFVVAGALVLILAIRAARNAAIAIRARIFAIATGLGLATWGLKGPLQLQTMVEEALGPWLDEPHEQVIAGVIVLVSVLAILTLVSIYFWIRALIRLASFAFVGLVLLAVAAIAWLAAEGGLGTVIPPIAGIDGLVLVEVAGVALLVVGAARLLRPKAPAPVRRA